MSFACKFTAPGSHDCLTQDRTGAQGNLANADAVVHPPGHQWVRNKLHAAFANGFSPTGGVQNNLTPMHILPFLHAAG